ncbi:MAG: DMT family transporter [Burkholderiales bacterium]|jgi:drug/metabolite transporter (DMT)-like permease|nr:DMT family transporter [Burkholderiales bacterium]MBP6249820.1 DMT family transporter [Leptothrix sp. (in: b-proteobacteria)]
MTRPAAAAPVHPMTGIVLILLVAACFSLLDATVRHTGRQVPVQLILTLRYLFQAVAMGVWLAWTFRRPGGPGRSGFGTTHPRFQVLRGLLLLTSSAFGFYALQHLPVAEFTAIVMLTPVMVTLLAAWLLKEAVSPLRWALVAAAFTGTLIVVRPGSDLFGWAVLLPLGNATAYALFQLLTRRLAGVEDPYTTHFYTGLVGSLLLLAALPFGPSQPLQLLAEQPAATLGALALIGLFGTTGHLLLILALRQAPASTLMPFTYLQIGMAALLGWWFFGDLPDTWGWTGMAVIAASGAASAWLNLRAPSTRAVIAVAPEED